MVFDRYTNVSHSCRLYDEIDDDLDQAEQRSRIVFPVQVLAYQAVERPAEFRNSNREAAEDGEERRPSNEEASRRFTFCPPT